MGSIRVQRRSTALLVVALGCSANDDSPPARAPMPPPVEAKAAAAPADAPDPPAADAEPDPPSPSPPRPDIAADVAALRTSLGENAPDMEVRRALVEKLGASGNVEATEVLLQTLREPPDAQPVAVHRAAATALGRLRDPAAVDDLLAATFRIPDAPRTTSISERTKLAVVAIGSAAVPATLRMLAGTHPEVDKYRAANGLDEQVVTSVAASILGELGSADAVEPLLARFPDEPCAPGGPAADPADAMTRAVIARALGTIADPRAVGPLCRCLGVSRDPTDAFAMAEALGRIGGAPALDCLLHTVAKGEYDAAAVADPRFRHEIRWEAGRFAVLAAATTDAATISAAFAAAKDTTVRTELAAWQPGLDTLDRCKADADCFRETLADPAADWFARETAAVQLARLAGRDPDAAAAVSHAFSVRNPDARVTMAWLPRHILGPDARCEPCAEALTRILDAERGSLAPEYQLSVLTARATMAALGDLAP